MKATPMLFRRTASSRSVLLCPPTKPAKARRARVSRRTEAGRSIRNVGTFGHVDGQDDYKVSDRVKPHRMGWGLSQKKIPGKDLPGIRSIDGELRLQPPVRSPRVSNRSDRSKRYRGSRSPEGRRHDGCQSGRQSRPAVAE